MNQKSVKIENKNVYIDGVPRQILSGAVHYFRSLPERWDTICEKAKAMGLDAIETYVAWNVHEPEPGKYDFGGRFDLEKFIRTVQKHGLYLIVRPGPYICAEWTNGGLPPWLTNLPGCKIRRDNPVYMEHVQKWYAVLLPMLIKYQYHLGGPIIMTAVENEYGSYGSDKEYLGKLKQMFLDAGFEIPLITADGGGDQSMTYGGLIPGCPASITSGPDDCLKKLELLRGIRPDEPDMCMEFWCGTFDHCGDTHKEVEEARAEKELETLIKHGVSVNIYMFHGGTNFGFTAGANFYYGGVGETGVKYAPVTTSYDYAAPLDEAADPTPKYYKYRDIIRKYRKDVPLKEFQPSVKKNYGQFQFTQCAPFFDHLSEIATMKKSEFPLFMQDLGIENGFILYRTMLPGPSGKVYPTTIDLWQLHDRAQIFLDQKFLTDFDRSDNRRLEFFSIENECAQLDVLVENQGYINFGPASGYEHKGVEEVLVGGGCNHFVKHFECWGCPMTYPANLTFEPMRELPENTPSFYRAEFEIDEPADTYLKYPGVKGLVYLNGFHLGKYWNIGPGDSLFVPAELLKKGKNEIICFEQYRINSGVEFADARNWGETIYI